MFQFLQTCPTDRRRPAQAIQPPQQYPIDLAAPRASSNCSRGFRSGAPEPISFTGRAIAQPRRTAYSRMAHICNGMVY